MKEHLTNHLLLPVSQNKERSNTALTNRNLRDKGAERSSMLRRLLRMYLVVKYKNLLKAMEESN